MNSINFKVAIATALLMLGGTSLASANTINVGDSATGTGPYDLLADGTHTDSFVQVVLSSTIAFSSITSLSANFTDLLGGSAAGSPRIKVRAVGGDYFSVYLGPPPSFGGNVAALQAFSGMNMVNGTNDTGYQASGSYNTFASFQSNALYLGDQIDAISFILEHDSNVDQHLTLNGLSLNGTNLLAAAAPVPEPITISLFGAGVVGAAALRRRKAKKN